MADLSQFLVSHGIYACMYDGSNNQKVMNDKFYFNGYMSKHNLYIGEDDFNAAVFLMEPLEIASLANASAEEMLADLVNTQWFEQYNILRESILDKIKAGRKSS